MSRLSVIGTGYVGLVTGTCLAAKGHRVLCVDVDQEKVEQIKRGDPPIHEPGLAELMRSNLGRRLDATTRLDRAVRETDVSLVAVGTPSSAGRIDLRYVKDVAREMGRVLAEKRDYHAVVVKSTVVPGTTDEVVVPLLEEHSRKAAGRDFGVGVNPEFLREGQAVQDFMEPDRIVMGGVDDRTLDELDVVYEVFSGVDKIRTNNQTAEMIKYAANSLFATLISFSNEIGNLCSQVDGVDVVDVMQGVHLDHRLTPVLADGDRLTPGLTSYLEAGCGFGGSCFPKDVEALAAHGREVDSPMRLLDAVLRINEEQPLQLVRLLEQALGSLRGLEVSVLGLAFKPGTDDVRRSPAIPVIAELLDGGAQVRAYDPVVRELPEPMDAGRIRQCDTLEAAITGVDAVVVVTRWEEFRRLPELLSGWRSPPVVVDGRRMIEKAAVPRYRGIGL